MLAYMQHVFKHMYVMYVCMYVYVCMCTYVCICMYVYYVEHYFYISLSVCQSVHPTWMASSLVGRRMRTRVM